MVSEVVDVFARILLLMLTIHYYNAAEYVRPRPRVRLCGEERGKNERRDCAETVRHVGGGD